MSVLIKGMKMPKDGPYRIGINTDGDITIMAFAERGKDGRIYLNVYELEEVQDEEQKHE